VDINAPPGMLQPAARCTRGHQQDLHVPHVGADINHHSLFLFTARLWNSLSKDVVAAPSLPALKIFLKDL
jgi:hypothetical protein